MTKYERLQEMALAFGGGTPLSDEFTSLYYALKQIEQEEQEA